MRAITIQPGRAGSIQLEDLPEPSASESVLLVQAVALGICGTDHEILAGHHGAAPPNQDRLVLGHESLGRVLAAPPRSGFARGDMVVGIVRHPDPVPCSACAMGEWDMCRNGLYGERGIKEIDGFGAERFLLDPAFAVVAPNSLGLLAVLIEPASILAKAWDQIERIGRRTRSWQPRTVLVTGAGPVGLLAGLMAVQRGLDLHVFDRTKRGRKPALVRALGGTYHSQALPSDLQPDISLECTGAPSVILDVLARPAGGTGIVCLVGVSSAGRPVPFDVGSFNRAMVLGNNLVFGSVNANRAHYAAGAEALKAADPGWLAGLVTRRVPLARWREAFEDRDDSDDIKVVLIFESASAKADRS